MGLLDDDERAQIISDLPSVLDLPRRQRDPADKGVESDDGNESNSSSDEGGDSNSSQNSANSSDEEADEGGGDGSAPVLAATLVPDGFTAVSQTPLMELQALDVGRHIFAQVKLPNTSMRFTFGKIQRYFSPDSTSRWSKLYNCDVLFTGQRGAVGMHLQLDGDKTAYDATATTTASEGTWFFLIPTPTTGETAE